MPEQVLQSRVVRRRNPRPINSCVECRTRKSRCSKTHPCQNCTAFGRECVFITVPESAARRKNRDTSKSSADWTQPLPLRTQTTQPENSSTNATTTTPGTPPRDYEWEAYQQHVDIDGDAWEKLPAEPEETHDDVYEDEDEDEDQIATDLTIRIGRMIICENITGFFRPQYAEELGKLLSEHPDSVSSVAGQRAPQSSGLLSAENMPSLSPSLNLLLGATTPMSKANDLETPEIPTRLEAEALFARYVESVSPLAHVLHIPSFRRVFERFWVNIEVGNTNQNSCTALILSVCMAAAATLSPLQAKAQFGITKEDLFLRLQKATERALLRANWSKTSNIRTLQALTIYLIPLCRAQISRATSVLVGALVRLAQCIGIHRISHNSVNSLTPYQRHVRSLLWYQICFLDFKTAEAQGPHPSIRSDDFDIPLPLNVDDDVFEIGTPKWQPNPTPVQGWTDVTLSLIRYECNELHRLIFRGRIEMDRKAITLHDLRARVEAQKRQIHSKYLHFLDAQDPMQRYAGLVATLLMARCDSMLLYRHLPQTSLQPRSESENRLRDVLLTAALTTLEIGATLDTLPSLSAWAWYSTTYQQYHAVLLLLTELYRTPDLLRKERMTTIIDHIFGHCYGISVRERCSDLLWTVKENLEAFYIMKGIRNYKSMVTTPTPLQLNFSHSTTTSAAPSQSQVPTLQSLTQQQQQASQQGTGTSATPDFASMSLHTNLGGTTMDSMNPNVDLETLLANVLSSTGSSGPEGFEDFLAGMQSSDPSAIFVPHNDGGNGPGPGNEWMINDGWGFNQGNGS